jgi:3D (Asp-Asp-Asp) domain-containing protein
MARRVMTIRKLLLASMTVMLLLGTPAAGAEENTQTPFTDIQGHWAEKEITQLYAAGAIRKNEKGVFRPDDLITRGELAALLLAAKGFQPVSVETSHFADVSTDSWLSPYAETAYRLGFFHGQEEDGKLYFKPDQTVERQEMINIVLRAKGDSGKVDNLLWSTALKTLKPYSDQQDVKTWNQKAVAYALLNKIAAPYEDGSLKPTKRMTRAEAAIYAYHNLLVDRQQSLPRLPHLNTPYKQEMTVESTSYAETDVKAYLGWPLREGIVAVDPKVIPLGTHLYIEGYGYAVAADTGGAVKEKIVDVFLPSLQAALAYGRQKDTKVYILD